MKIKILKLIKISFIWDKSRQKINGNVYLLVNVLIYLILFVITVFIICNLCTNWILRIIFGIVSFVALAYFEGWFLTGIVSKFGSYLEQLVKGVDGYESDNIFQSHRIILYRNTNSKNINFYSIAQEVLEVLEVFNQFDVKYRPNYRMMHLRENAPEFECNYDNVVKILKYKYETMEGISGKFGYCLSFFSSKNDEESFDYFLKVGSKCKDSHDTLIIDIPIVVNLYDKDGAKLIEDMFKKVVVAFKPFWGCVANRYIYNKHFVVKDHSSYIYKGKPSTVHWLNYWSDEIINCIGVDQIQKVLNLHQQLYFKGGIFKIKDCALDVNDKLDMEFHRQLDMELGL